MCMLLCMCMYMCMCMWLHAMRLASGEERVVTCEWLHAMRLASAAVGTSPAERGELAVEFAHARLPRPPRDQRVHLPY